METFEKEWADNSADEIAVVKPEVESDRNKRKWAIFKANVFDKGAVFEDLSLKTKNRELIGKWDFTILSEARTQHLIGNDAEGVKSLNDIRTEVENTGQAKKLYEYMYHKHNIDRMTLSEKYKDTDNKPVFSDSVTAEVSQSMFY
ncbi:MAG: hypothetical protein ACI4CT_06675 [Lachnospiraceae bacterium]